MKESCRAFLNDQFGGDEDIVKEIYAEYTASAKEKTEELAAVTAQEDWEAMDRVAHTLKGNALVAGDQETADVAIAMRGASKLQDRAQADELVARLRALVAGL